MKDSRVLKISLMCVLPFLISRNLLAQSAQNPPSSLPGASDERMAGSSSTGTAPVGLTETENKELDSFESEMNRQVAEPTPVTKSKQEPTSSVPIESITDLSKLAPFREVSVLQKRFLPKTQRFQLSGGLSMVTNDPWFWNFGGNLRFGYYFREAWGVEFLGEIYSHSERDSVKDLNKNNGVQTTSMVYVNNYIGADIIWNPIYGKMSLRNLRIIPYDIFFALGAGSVGVGNAVTDNVTSFHLGTGQIFALSKSTAFRWNFDWKYFNAQPYSDDPAKPFAKGTFSYFMLSAGISYFFPEAKYR